MTQSFHGCSHTHSFFEGWYFKHQSSSHTLILIPAFHLGPSGQSYASLQVILDNTSYYLPFSSRDFAADTERLSVRLGQSIFSGKGCRLHIDLPDGTPIRGHIGYNRLHSPKRSFMGPFAHLPLPCFHEVLSLAHRLRGQVLVGEEIWDFNQGLGYLEKDWGTSFPDSYLWLQCGWHSPTSCTSLMLTVADLKFRQHPVTACSSLILHDGKEYRLSTYQGARLIRYGARRIALRQGSYLLQIILPPHVRASCPTEHDTCSMEPDAHRMETQKAALLHAPQNGRMTRIIEEHPRCTVRCQLYKGTKKILDVEKDWGSFELVRSACPHPHREEYRRHHRRCESDKTAPYQNHCAASR